MHWTYKWHQQTQKQHKNHNKTNTCQREVSRDQRSVGNADIIRPDDVS